VSERKPVQGGRRLNCAPLLQSAALAFLTRIALGINDERAVIELGERVIAKRDGPDSSRFGQARAALEHFQGLMRQHLRALV
jgi:hypothetical protein